MTEQGDVALLQDPVAQELLTSRFLAHFAYTWTDGTPRVVPIWFHWDGQTISVGTSPNAPKIRALPDNPQVALTIDDGTAFPYKALLIRGEASIDLHDDVTQEYTAAARRYFGEEQGAAWAASLQGQPMAKVIITPTWVCVLDFVERFPSALSA